MPTLVPSILETTKQGFSITYNQEIKLPGVQRLQVDFGDGKFVPNTILPIVEIDLLNPAYHFEAHLMCEQPTDFLDYKIAGFGTIIVHYEAYALPTQLRIAIQEIKKQGMEPAICLKPETPVSVLEQFMGDVKHFQLMSVHPGFQGTPFLEETYQHIDQLRKLLPNAIIEIDGGVSVTNIKKIAQSGVDYIILGSAITKAPNMLEAYNTLVAEINKN